MNIADKYHALVLVDESHSLGVLGKTGRYCTVVQLQKIYSSIRVLLMYGRTYLTISAALLFMYDYSNLLYNIQFIVWIGNE